MIALDRQGWILVGFAVLFFTAIAVSVCGWILVWRARREPGGEIDLPGDEPGPEGELDTPEPSSGPGVEADTASLPPGNPLR